MDFSDSDPVLLAAVHWSRSLMGSKGEGASKRRKSCLKKAPEGGTTALGPVRHILDDSGQA